MVSHIFATVLVTQPNILTMRRDVFQAIADPRRREILNMIAHQSLNLNAVAENFNVSRPAISKHIKILTECGLIVIIQQGRERYCKAQLHKLNEVSKWIEQYKVFWTKKLGALENFLEKESPKTKKTLPIVIGIKKSKK
jgi:DNA-binding transcriptional ArsR family regulator